jgi:hypothetical protein
MIKDIRYSGISGVPSDYDAPDGSLAAAINLINEDGTALQPMHQPKKLFTLNRGEKLFLHKVTDGTNYIAYNPANQEVVWIDPNTEERQHIEFSAYIGNILGVSAIGNILILATTSALQYIYFDAANREYRYLGSKIPDIQMQFGLASKCVVQQYDNKVEILDASKDDEQDSTGWGLQAVKDYEFKQSELNAYTSFNDIKSNTEADEFTVETSPYGNSANISNASGSGYYAIDYLYTSGYLEIAKGLTLQKGVYQKITWEKPNDQKGSCIAGIRVEVLYEDASDYTLVWRQTTREPNKTNADSYTFLPDKNIVGVRVLIKYWVSSSYASTSLPVIHLALYSGLDTAEATSLGNYSVKYSLDSFNTIKAALNKFVADESTNKGYFIYPFLVRYAIILYDGSIGYASAPALMFPNTGYVPALSISKEGSLVTGAFCSSLYAYINNAIPDEWHDLIQSVEIYVSAPLYTYNEGEEFNELKNLFRYYVTTGSSTYGSVYYGSDDNALSNNFKTGYLDTEMKLYTSALSSDFIGFLRLSEVKYADWIKKLESVAAFYKVAAIDIDDLPEMQTPFKIELEEGCLKALTNQQQMQDIPFPYDTYQNCYMYAYNNRLNIAPTRIKLPTPTAIDLLNPIGNDTDANTTVVATVYLKSSYGRRSVILAEKCNYRKALNQSWFFYPDSNAYKVKLDIYTNLSQYDIYSHETAEYTLKQHPNLNGAYAIAATRGGTLPQGSAEVLNTVPTINYEDINPLREVSGLVYYSAPNNPFFFGSSPVQIGAGQVLALSTAARALSEGQFGQFPLYAFTSEGVWALETNSDGTYLARKPITRDVITSTESICQIDSAVLFATDRGIMHISGSTTECITDSLITDEAFQLGDLPAIKQLHSMLNHPLAENCIPTATFRQFLKACRMVYDYPNQHIILYNPSYTYAYILSLKSKQWGMIYSTIQSHANAYPNAIALALQSTDDKSKYLDVLDFSQTGSPQNSVMDISSTQLLITRPLKLDAPDILKTIRTIIQRGRFATGHVTIILYGSRDLIHWHLIRSSKNHISRALGGTPFRYFRIAVAATLLPGESISGASIDFDPRYQNRLR